MRYALIALMALTVACASARERAFRVVQDNTQGFAAGFEFDGQGKAYTGTRYAYVDGEFKGKVGAYWEGTTLWGRDIDLGESTAWELYWNDETNKPDVRTVELAVAKDALDRALPAPE